MFHMSKPSLISFPHRGNYVKVSASRSRWGPSPGSSGHAAYHEKDHLLDVSRTKSGQKAVVTEVAIRGVGVGRVRSKVSYDFHRQG